MSKQTYSIGTKIMYLPPSYARDEALRDKGKKGVIVSLDIVGDPIIFLPQSEHISCSSTQSKPATWETAWSSIEEILPQKNQQLLFAFMEQENGE